MLLSTLALPGCIDGAEDPPVHVAGGDAEQGRELLREWTCGGCHMIPGVPAASGTEGPPLDRWAERAYIAGAVRNTPEHMIVWIVDPQRVEPGTLMPDMGVPVEDARHMTAYLFTLGDTRPLGPPHPFPERWLHSIGGGKKK